MAGGLCIKFAGIQILAAGAVISCFVVRGIGESFSVAYKARMAIEKYGQQGGARVPVGKHYDQAQTFLGFDLVVHLGCIRYVTCKCIHAY